MTEPACSPAQTVAAWRAAAESGDADAAAALLAPDVTVISPLTAKFRFEGRAQAHDMLSAAFEVISDLRCHTEVGAGPTRALFYYGRAGTVSFEEAQLLRLDENGFIRELTFFGRPLPGLTAVMTAIGPALLRRQKRSSMARLISVVTAPLHAMTRFGDERVVPLADPSRAPHPAGAQPGRAQPGRTQPGRTQPDQK
ncbi:nuclear transport factor 2 family protein [Frankia sp. AgKG'84/4]|uniref:nuclear transport factor 2 family protein n=1 Tax=Frankia sp. AgKG'84/4 TaxID=573490 RepID=UPI00200EC469|nr:nuclear transport factor 2 family protein [Frankia sp. AgKG'84/4]MCL9793321.1 nuclear transport factor 2 family protein [Frankia sp. AgKG'84/4]